MFESLKFWAPKRIQAADIRRGEVKLKSGEYLLPTAKELDKLGLETKQSMDWSVTAAEAVHFLNSEGHTSHITGGVRFRTRKTGDHEYTTYTVVG